MNNQNRINKLRRLLMRSLTKDVGTRHINKKGEGDTNASIKKILISRPNHRLGNQLLLTPLIDELEATFPGCTIDVFVRGGLAHVLFKNFASVDGVFKLPKRPLKEIMGYLKAWNSVSKANYDLAINVARGSSSGRMSIQRAKARYKFFGDLPEAGKAKYPDYMHMAKHPVYVLRTEIDALGFNVQNGPVPVMDLRLDAAELANAKAALDKLVPADKKTISIFTYATGSKCYTPEWWLPVYEKLKARFPDYNIVEVLPAENVSQINYAAPTFYSHDVREIAALIANTAVFIGADSGIMHLASAAKASTVGLFSVTDATKYGPYGNDSIAVNTNETDADALVDVVSGVLAKK